MVVEQVGRSAIRGAEDAGTLALQLWRVLLTLPRIMPFAGRRRTCDNESRGAASQIVACSVAFLNLRSEAPVLSGNRENKGIHFPRLTVNGQPLPIIFVSPTQINAQMPFQAIGNVTMIVHTPGGVSDANSAFTDDGQLVMGFLPGAFVVDGKTSVTVDITPLASCPQPPGIQFVTNVYQVTASAPLNTAKPANLVTVYSNLKPDPSGIYQSQAPDGPWNKLPQSQPGQPFTIVARTSTFGYFAAGYAASSPQPGAVRVGGGQLLPIIVAGLIVVVVLAGLPLAIIRRRRPSNDKDG